MNQRKVQFWIINNLHAITGQVEDYFFPRLCIICNKPRTPQQQWFCSSCHHNLIKNQQSRIGCPRCSQNQLYRVCACDFSWDYPFESIFSLLDFDDAVQQIMYHVKYFGKNRLAWYMGNILSEYIPDSFFFGFDIITAVPLHWKRQLSGDIIKRTGLRRELWTIVKD